MSESNLTDYQASTLQAMDEQRKRDSEFKRAVKNLNDREKKKGNRVQVSSHGCNRYSAQVFDGTGKLVRDINL